MNATTGNQPDHRTLPRKKRPPSLRDQGIYLEFLDGGRTQADLAENHRLTQPRISQILSRVQKWRANLRPQEEGELSYEERRRLNYYANREMHESIRRRAIRDYDSAPRQLKTSKTKTDKDGNIIQEEIVREILPPVGLLKTAQRSVENLCQESDKPPPPEPQDRQTQERYFLQNMLDRLITMRIDAEEAGQVPRTRAHAGDGFGPYELVHFWLAALLGDTAADLPWDVHLQEGGALKAL